MYGFTLFLCVLILRSASLLLLSSGSVWSATPDMSAVVKHYADLAHAGYEDSLIAARRLDEAIIKLVVAPTDVSLNAARAAWKAARVPYMQTEVFRFGNPIVDEWEGRVNSWPLDEGFIDYVDQKYGRLSGSNPFYVANIIANPFLKIGGRTIDARFITPEFLSGTLQEAGGVESNVATGYHAIEFLLWGQDLDENGPGRRPASDFDVKRCTGGHCDRRGAYLKAVSRLLVDDLKEMVGHWADGGAARMAVTQSPRDGVRAILTGLGSLSYGELAGERMQLGLMLHDSEEEQDCFSDNTHLAHYYNLKGIQNVYSGHYARLDGTMLEGPGVTVLVRARARDVDNDLRSAMHASMRAIQAIRKRAEAGEAYDRLIADGYADGNALVQSAIDRLIEQTSVIEKAIAALDVGEIDIVGSDSLDSPDDIFK